MPGLGYLPACLSVPCVLMGKSVLHRHLEQVGLVFSGTSLWLVGEVVTVVGYSVSEEIDRS